MVNGIIGKKLGMTQIFAPDGTVTPVTVIKAGPCVVVQRKTISTDGYEAVQLGLVEDKVLVDQFTEDDVVDVISVSKGRGFAGFVKRHGFGGGRATHGSMFHRAPGSIGASAYPSRVIKGTRMAGHMGNVRKTAKNLRVVAVDTEKNLLMIRGAVPGPNGAYVVIKQVQS